MPIAARDLSKAANAVTADETTKLTRIWQELLGVGPIGPDQNYFDLGGDSSLAVRMFARIEEVFRVRLPLATLFETPTIRELAEVLHQQVAPLDWSPLVSIQPLGSRPPFFCIHGAGGNVLIYRDLSKNLGADQPFYGLQTQGLDGVAAPLETIEEMAALYAREIRKVSPHGPYFIGGYCMGGTVAFEVAQQIQAQGEEIAMLALFDTMNWSNIARASIWGRGYHILQRLAFHIANFLCLDFAGMIKFSLEKLEDLGDRLPVWIGIMLAKSDAKHLRRTLPESQSLARIWQINDRACSVYVPRVFAGTITDFRPRKQYRRYNRLDAKWQALAGNGEEIVVLPVYPAGMLVEPFVKHLAVALRKSIDDSMRRDEIIQKSQ
ncbi:MAG: thioesterase domain-containing protein [Terriglobales bacterium]